MGIHVRSDTVFHTQLPPLTSGAPTELESSSTIVSTSVALDPPDYRPQPQVAIGTRRTMEVYLGCLSALTIPEVEKRLSEQWPPGWELQNALSAVLEASNFTLADALDIRVGVQRVVQG